MRKLNFIDQDTGEKFYRVEEVGRALYSKQYQIRGYISPTWTPLMTSPKKVLKYIADEKAKVRLQLTEKKAPKKHLFVEVFEECFKDLQERYIKTKKSPKTLQKFHGLMNNYVIGTKKRKLKYKTFANKAVEDITVYEVKELKNAINTIYGDSYSRKTIGLIFSYIDKVFRYARDKNYVSNVFCMNLKVDAIGLSQNSKQAVRNFFSEKEFDLFLSKYDDLAYDYFYHAANFKHCRQCSQSEVKTIAEFRTLAYRTYFETLFYTGARKAEGRGLKWSDILPATDRFDLCCLKIERQYGEEGAHFIGKDVYDEKPKTDSSVRKCVMHEALYDALERLRSWLIDHNLYEEDNYIFFDFYAQTPKPLPRRNIDRTFDYIKENTGIEKKSVVLNGIERKITVHGLRHAYCTVLLEKGMDKQDVAKFLGHKDTTMVEKVYMHYIDPIDMEEERRLRNMQFFRK